MTPRRLGDWCTSLDQYAAKARGGCAALLPAGVKRTYVVQRYRHARATAIRSRATDACLMRCGHATAGPLGAVIRLVRFRAAEFAPIDGQSASNPVSPCAPQCLGALAGEQRAFHGTSGTS